MSSSGSLRSEDQEKLEKLPWWCAAISAPILLVAVIWMATSYWSKSQELAIERIKKNPPPPKWQLKMWPKGEGHRVDTYKVQPMEITTNSLKFHFSNEKGYTRVFNPTWKSSFRVGAVKSPGILCEFVGDTPQGVSGGYCFYWWHTPGEILRGHFWRAGMQSGKTFEEIQKSTKLEEEGIRKNAELLKEGGDIVLDSEVQLWLMPYP